LGQELKLNTNTDAYHLACGDLLAMVPGIIWLHSLSGTTTKHHVQWQIRSLLPVSCMEPLTRSFAWSWSFTRSIQQTSK